MIYFLVYNFFTFEYWRKIPGTNYWASNMGNIMSEYTMKSMYQSTHTVGYRQVNLRIDGKRITKKPHQLMLLAFEGPSNGMDVNHIDGVKDHNFLWNLEYLSKSDNQKHAVRSGLKNSGITDSRSHGVIQKDFLGNTVTIHGSLSEAQKNTGIGKGSIMYCCQGIRNKAGGFAWEYVVA